MASLSRITTRTVNFSRSRDRVFSPRSRRNKVRKTAKPVINLFSRFPIFTN